MNLTEPQLKAALLSELRRKKRVSEKSIVANELTLGKTGVRADLAIIGRLLIGVEVKSERDSLRRLQKQVDVYLQYFDKLILVVGPRHLEQAALLDEAKIELWVETGAGSVRRIRSPTQGRPRAADSYHPLVTLRELHRFGEKRHAGTVINKRALREALTSRYRMTSDRFWNETRGRRINSTDLRLLSRVADRRDAAKAWDAARAKRWEKWANRDVAD